MSRVNWHHKKIEKIETIDRNDYNEMAKLLPDTKGPQSSSSSPLYCDSTSTIGRLQCIQPPSLFPHFCFLHYSLYQATHNTLEWQSKNRFLNFCKFTQVFRPFAMRLKIELRCILFSLIILDVSTTWLESTCGTFNWLDMMLKRTHLSI